LNGDPIDPISFERAVKEAWERLAAYAGLNLNEHVLGADEEQSPELEAERREREERLGELREEAQLRVWGLTLIGELRAWTVEGEHWKRPTEQVLRARLTRANDEPSGLYVDRQQVAAVTSARWPDEFGDMASTATVTIDSRASHLVKRGRPPGSGSYEADDAPLLVEMAVLIAKGKARSANKAAEMVADGAPGASFASKVKRLRDKFLATHRQEP
jgi:hypothetical protein